MSDEIRPLRIPVDGALSALRARMSALGKRADGSTWAREWLEASAAVECLVMALDPHPDDVTPEGVLRRVAALVALLPADRPELWCALPVDAVAQLPGATVDTQPRRDEPGKVLHVARARVDGLLVVGLETREGSVSP